MTSYFNAWLDNQNLYGNTKKWITAFVPRLSMNEKNVDNFFHVYPDGHLISIIREPKSWFVSARTHATDEYGDIDKAISFWTASARSMLTLKEKYPRRAHILSFGDLLTDTEKTMRQLSLSFDIEFCPSLLAPTFNGFPIKADSSFKVKKFGVNNEPLQRHRHILNDAEKKGINDKAGKIYERCFAFKRIYCLIIFIIRFC